MAGVVGGLLAALSSTAWAQLESARTDAADRWAVVNANGTLARGFGVKSVSRYGAGDYGVKFDAKSIVGCGYVLTMGAAYPGQPAPSGYTRLGPPGPTSTVKNILYVATFAVVNGYLANADRAFHLYVACR